MVEFKKIALDNGLRVLIHEDHSTPLVAVNTLYLVGSRDEDPDHTGFAHLFEHLMFTGSRQAKDFDEPLQQAGGENNAYTTNDYTTFYEILPAENLETVLWLESDRMKSLRLNQRAFNVQRKVVVEEFKETSINEPYGSSWHHLSDMMYKVHPYRWPVIGLEPDHIANASLKELRKFYKRYYRPNNAIISISGNVKAAEAEKLVRKWFEKVPAGDPIERDLQEEPPLEKSHYRQVISDVPVTAVFLCFRMPGRKHPDFYPIDLLSDVLGHGLSSRLYRRLQMEKKIFSSIDCYVTANFDPGLFVLEGKVREGITQEQALEALWSELKDLADHEISARELEKIKHRFESTLLYSELSVLNKAQNLCFYEALGDANLMNEECDLYLQVTPEQMKKAAAEIFREDNSGTLVYVPSESFL